MLDKCRLCGKEKLVEQLIDIKAELVQSTLQKCSIFIDYNKLLPQSCCFTCFEILEHFCKFLDNINQVQEKLSRELNEQLNDKLAGEVTNGKSINSGHENLETTAIYFQQDLDIKQEFDSGSVDELATVELVKIQKVKRKKKATKSAHEKLDIKISKSWKKYSMAEIFERELKQGYCNKSLAHLPVSENERNSDGSLNANGLNKYGTFKWSDYEWSCVFCTDSFTELKLLTAHCRTTHHCDTKYRCNSCCRDFVIYPAFYNHILGHNPTLKFCCFFCSIFFQDLVSLYNHQEKEHDTSNHFCLYCGLISKTSGKLKDHVVSHLKPEEITELYVCDLCGKGFRTRKFVRAHILLHLSNRKSTKDYICHVCGKSFSQKKYLYGHRLVHQESRPFQCEFCPKCYKSKRELAQHCVGSHPGENHEYKDKKVRAKKHVCDICKQAFMSEKVMIDHKNTHSGVTPHLCLMCGKRFTTLKFLRLHQARHTTEKKHRCTICEASFKVRSDLTRHSKRIHSSN